MSLHSRDVAIIAVLCAVVVLAGLTYISYKCNPSLFRRQHRARPGLRKMSNPEDKERINPVKLERFMSSTTMGSRATNTTQHSTKSAKSSTHTSTEELPEHLV